MRVQLSSLLAFFGLAASASAFCGTPPPSNFLNAVHQSFAQAYNGTGIEARSSPLTTIQIWWHIIRQDNTLRGGLVPRKFINDQVSYYFQPAETRAQVERFLLFIPIQDPFLITCLFASED